MKIGEKLILIVPAGIIIITFLVYLLNGHINFYDINFDKLNTFGGFVGGLIGAFLTVVATLYVYKTFYTQKEELKLQKDLISQQQFEATFFNMLNVHRELKNSLHININRSIDNININDNDVFNGVSVFRVIRLDFEVLYKKFKSIGTNAQNFSIKRQSVHQKFLNKRNLNNENDIIKLIFWEIFENYQDAISHYFRNTYHILKYIRQNEEKDNGSESHKKFKQYANIFQSQLNVDEHFLLFYNYIIFDKNDESNDIYWPKNIVNHYELLENLGKKNLLDKQLHNNQRYYTFNIK